VAIMSSAYQGWLWHLWWYLP